jgi:hypothetical protein
MYLEYKDIWNTMKQHETTKIQSHLPKSDTNFLDDLPLFDG